MEKAILIIGITVVIIIVVSIIKFGINKKK